MATLVNLTGNLSDLIGSAWTNGRVKVWIKTNVTEGVIIDATGNTLRLGDAAADVASDGSFTFTGLWATNSASNPTSFQYKVFVRYSSRQPGNQGTITWDSGWFSLTATSDLADVAEEQYVPPSWMTTATQTLQGYVDEGADLLAQQQAISGLTGEDTAVANLVQDDVTPSATYTALSAAYAARAGNIDATVRKLADDFADVNVLVLGDSTAAQTNQFPDQLMPQVQALYPHRTLQKATWDNTTHTWGSFSTVGSAGTGSYNIKFWQGAVSGTVCEQPLNYLDAWIGAVQPDLVIVHYGHNYGKTAADGGQPSDAVMDQVFRERYLRFIAVIKNVCPRADVLLVSQNPYLTAGARTQISNVRAQTVREIAADLGCAYGPVLEAYEALGNTTVQATYLNADGLHPLTSGATNGALVAADALVPMFKKDNAHEITARQPSPFAETAMNLLTNGDFIEFSSPPTLTGWTASNVTLSKDTTNYESANGYSVKGTGTAAANCIAYQTLPIRRVRGKTITFAARFYVPSSVSSSQPGRVQLSGDGGMGVVTSGTITNVRDNWVWVFVTAKVPDATTAVTATLIFGTASGENASCDRAVVCLGALPKDAHPRGALTTYVTQVATTEDALTTGEIVPRRNLMNSAAVSHTSGTLALSYFTADKTETINNVTLYTGTTAAGATPTLVRVGIYSLDGSGNGTLVASTPNDTTLLAAASTAYTKALSAPFSKVAGTRYAIGLLVVSGATMPSFQGPLAVSSAPSQTVFGLPPRLCGRLTGQTDLPASFTEAGLTAYSLRSHVLLT